MAPDELEPKAGKSGGEDSARRCPYCRSKFSEGEETLTCRTCSAVHHEECWTENGGCAVWGCESRPKPEGNRPGTPADPQAGQTRSDPRTRTQLPRVQSGSGRSTTSVKRSGKGRKGGGAYPNGQDGQAAGPMAGQLRPVHLLIGLGILSVTLLAVIVVVFGSRDADPPDPNPNPSPPSSSSADEVTASAPGNRFPQVSRETQRRDIQRLIRDWHIAAGNGDRATMWQLLSERKRRQISASRYGTPDSDGVIYTPYDGRSGWEEDQSDFAGSFDGSQAQVQLAIPSYPKDGVRLINVRNMYTDTGCEWSGYTWVRFERGRWTYEPGYLVSRERKDDWPEDKQGELLGKGCQ